MAGDRESEKIMKRLLIIFILFTSICYAQEVRTFTYNQLADAIYHAEGGSKADYLYGIRSVHYDSRQEARRICINTIRNNMRRFKERTHGSSNYEHYLPFLASRYCPTTGKSLSKAEKILNKHWLKNIKWFLNNPKEVIYE